MEKEQWDLLWTGEHAFWKAVPHLLAAGHHTAEELTEPRRPRNGRPYKIPRLMAAQEGERTQLVRILLSRGIGGIDDRTRGLTQRWFDMVDWRSAHVGNTRLGVSRSIEGYTETLKGEVHQQHPARTWVERQEQKTGGHEPERIPTTRECCTTCCRWSQTWNRERRKQRERLDGKRRIPADTRNKCAEA